MLVLKYQISPSIYGGTQAGFQTAGAFAFIQTGQGTDQNKWDFFCSGATLYLRALNDAEGSFTAPIKITRTGTTITGVTLGGPVTAPSLSVATITGLTTPLSIAQGGTGTSTSRTAVSDAAYTVLTTDRVVAYTAITAARAVTLPAASAFPAGSQLLVVDESGSCSATNTITLNRAGTDTINGAASAVIAAAYGFVAIESNGSNKWTVVDQSTASMAQQSASAVAITGGSISGLSSLATTGTSTFGGAVAETIQAVTTASATVSAAAGLVTVNFAGAVAITGPASPPVGRRFEIVDISGAAATNNITYTPASGTINGAASYVLNVNRGNIKVWVISSTVQIIG